MSAMDIIILIITIIILLSIIFFTFIFPKIKGKKISCNSCPEIKKIKRAFKDIKKDKNK